VKVLLGSVDVIVMWLGVKQSSATVSQFTRLLSLGVGWTLAHHIAYYLPGYWIHARSLQFTGLSLQDAIVSLAFFVRRIAYLLRRKLLCK